MLSILDLDRHAQWLPFHVHPLQKFLLGLSIHYGEQLASNQFSSMETCFSNSFYCSSEFYYFNDYDKYKTLNVIQKNLYNSHFPSFF